MRELNRLLRYLRPFWFYILASVLAMALVGVLEAFRLLLIGPIF
jgi:ATP-binding cassette, subfamily B, bacterial MsbA